MTQIPTQMTLIFNLPNDLRLAMDQTKPKANPNHERTKTHMTDPNLTKINLFSTWGTVAYKKNLIKGCHI